MNAIFNFLAFKHVEYKTLDINIPELTCKVYSNDNIDYKIILNLYEI